MRSMVCRVLTRCVSLLAALTLSAVCGGCYTFDLWTYDSERSRRTPIRHETTLEVVEGVGRFDADRSASRIELEVVASAEAAFLVPRLASWTRDDPGVLILRPAPYGESRWLFAGASAFVPEYVELSMYEYSGLSTSVRNIDVVAGGVCAPEELGVRRIGESAIRDAAIARAHEPFERDTLGEGWVWQAFEAFDQHDWRRLVGWDELRPAVPVGWLPRTIANGAEAEVSDPDVMLRVVPHGMDASDLDLVVVLGVREQVGAYEVARIPAALLVGSLHQELDRVDGQVRWRYADTWRVRRIDEGDVVLDARVADLAPLPLASSQLALQVDTLKPAPAFRIVDNLSRLLRTPGALFLDVISWTLDPEARVALEKFLGLTPRSPATGIERPGR